MDRPENPYLDYGGHSASTRLAWQEGFDACLPWAKEQGRTELLEELRGKGRKIPDPSRLLPHHGDDIPGWLVFIPEEQP